MRAESIDRGIAMSAFDGGPITAARLAVICNVSVRTAAWFMCAMERKGELRRIKPTPMRENPDFGLFERVSND